MGDIFKTEPCCFLAQLRRFLHLCTFQARDVCEAGVIHQGAPRDVHGHRGLGGEPGGDGEQVGKKVVLLMEKKNRLLIRIDAHVESAVEYTTRASADTKKALEYQQKARQ